MNVDINLKGITDAAYVSGAAAERNELAGHGEALAREALSRAIV
jgi:formiminotetrahydrofolate cyclodeaminase